MRCLMSYDIYLKDPVTKKTILLDSPHQMRGGTACLGRIETVDGVEQIVEEGTRKAWLNITYNYSDIYGQVLGKKGIRTIYGQTGAESIPILKGAVDQLKDDVPDNYWSATEGNAKRALLCLVALAQMRPDGVWAGD